MTTAPTAGRGRPSTAPAPPVTASRQPGGERHSSRPRRGSPPGSFLLVLGTAAALPGLLLAGLGLLVALPGLALCWSSLRRLTTSVGEKLASLAEAVEEQSAAAPPTPSPAVRRWGN